MVAMHTKRQINFVTVAWHLCTSRDVMCKQIWRLCVPNLNLIILWSHGLVYITWYFLILCGC